jgi:phosphoesterase RecJ-like protein
LEAEGKVAWVTVHLAEMEEQGCDRSDIEGVVEYVRGIDTVELAVLFRESEPGKTKLSFRSRDYVDCSLLAGQFGGGGHFHAAGGNLDLSVEETIEQVLPAALKVVEDGVRKGAVES